MPKAIFIGEFLQDAKTNERLQITFQNFVEYFEKESDYCSLRIAIIVEDALKNMVGYTLIQNYDIRGNSTLFVEIENFIRNDPKYQQKFEKNRMKQCMQKAKQPVYTGKDICTGRLESVYRKIAKNYFRRGNPFK